MLITKCDVCSRCININSAGWCEIASHRGVNPRSFHVCSDACGEVFFARRSHPLTSLDFDQARELVAQRRDEAVASAWDERDAS